MFACIWTLLQCDTLSSECICPSLRTLSLEDWKCLTGKKAQAIVMIYLLPRMYLVVKPIQSSFFPLHLNFPWRNHIISKLSSCGDKMPDTHNLKEGGLVWLNRFGGFSPWSTDSKARESWQKGMAEQSCSDDSQKTAQGETCTPRDMGPVITSVNWAQLLTAHWAGTICVLTQSQHKPLMSVAPPRSNRCSGSLFIQSSWQWNEVARSLGQDGSESPQHRPGTAALY